MGIQDLRDVPGDLAVGRRTTVILLGDIPARIYHSVGLAVFGYVYIFHWVLGSIGDVRTDVERASLKSLFNHRLSSDGSAARSEWLDIVEGRHLLWANISSEKRELVRSIFNHTNMEIVKRARPSSVFNFAKASIGNLFLTGARLFTGSLESAIYLLSTICAVPSTVATLPAINSNFTHHISAGLEDGSQITGQNAISHPSAPTSLPDTGDTTGLAEAPFPYTPTPTTSASTPATTTPTLLLASPPRPKSAQDDPQAVLRETEAHDRIEDATLPGSLPRPRTTSCRRVSRASGTSTHTDTRSTP
ncbi:hypothetical protein NUW58_g1384 [Xylaria curta]|uniref:Uncharacterized protein n=1 Tax=Xylaria curta TaxID=42375 RepID=A0ACC1PNS2_9PEZI|nr:hypothetical protein NUW58_g1384 [Xylaria curta]